MVNGATWGFLVFLGVLYGKYWLCWFTLHLHSLGYAGVPIAGLVYVRSLLGVHWVPLKSACGTWECFDKGICRDWISNVYYGMLVVAFLGLPSFQGYQACKGSLRGKCRQN